MLNSHPETFYAIALHGKYGVFFLLVARLEILFGNAGPRQGLMYYHRKANALTTGCQNPSLLDRGGGTVRQSAELECFDKLATFAKHEVHDNGVAASPR